jgi:guanyl-specific ribonuclease Sa
MKKILINKLRKALKRIVIIAFFIITAAYAYSLNFSEIMYNPQGSDTGREWMELTNPECEDLEEFILFENNINHRINMFSNGTCDYPLICNDCTLILNEYNVTSRLYESSFTLSNTGEYIALKLNNTIIDSINYTNIESAEGESLTKHDEWKRAFPTPGYFIQYNNQTINQTGNITNNITINITTNNTINETINSTTNNTLNQTINVTLNETTNNASNNTINITLNETTLENNSSEQCNITIGIKVKDDKSIYYNKETIKFYNILNVSPNYKTEYYIEYWVEDIYGNILKNSIQTNNLNEKSYTPSITEKTVAIVIKNKIINITCNNFTQTNIINDSSEKILVLKNPDYKEKECDKCEKCTSTINKNEEEPKDEESNIDVVLKDKNLEISLYRGNDRKYVINTEIKNEKNRKVSDFMKVSLEKYSGATIEFPLLTKECGEFSIVTEGLGFIDTKKYVVECEQEITRDDTKEDNLSIQTIAKQQTSQQTTNAIDNILKEENLTKNISQFFHEPLITGNIVYESKNEKTKEYSLIGILILITGTLVYFAYKRILKKELPLKK